MNKAYRIILFSNILLFTAAAWASEAQFAIKESHKDSNGVTLKTASLLESGDQASVFGS